MNDFVPALGFHALTGAYDRVVAITTREQRWRSELLRLVAPNAGDRILDVGCGTGTFVSILNRACPAARITGVDPDPHVLRLATKKNASIELRRGMGDELREVFERRSFTKVVSSLVLHQCPLSIKRSILRSMHDALEPGGQLFIADYGEQRGWMRLLFHSVQLVDGFALTQPNADGLIPELIDEAGFVNTEETFVLPTATGSISIYRAMKQP